MAPAQKSFSSLEFIKIMFFDGLIVGLGALLDTFGMTSGLLIEKKMQKRWIWGGFTNFTLISPISLF